MSGTVDVDLNKVSQITNNGLEVGVGVSYGLAGVSNTIGSLGGITVILGILLVLIGVIFVVIVKPLHLFAKVGSAFHKKY